MRIRPLITGTCVVLAGLALLAWAEDSDAILIDDFSTGQTVLVWDPAASGDSQVSGSGILGGERDVVVTRDSDFGVAMAAFGDVLTYVHAANSEGTGLIVWDGADGDSALNPTGLGGIDFTTGGLENDLELPLLASNLPAPIVLTAYTDAANYSTATLLLPGGVPPEETMSVLLADFAVAAGSGADFTNIGAFSLFIDGSSTPGLLARFQSVNPEPSTATLLLFGIVVMATIRRSQRTS